jgi:tripeptidyl-peptidase-1
MRSHLAAIALHFAAAAATTTDAPAPWRLVGPSPPDTLLTFRLALALPPDGLAALREAHAAVSTPASPRWGQHLSREAADALARPPAAAQAAVLAHLRASCAASAQLTPCGAWAVVHASAACAQELFGVRAQEYSSGSGAAAAAVAAHGCGGQQPRVPAGLEAAVAAVAPCSRLPRLQRSAPQPPRAPSTTTPTTIRQHYQLGAYEAAGAGRLQVAGFLNEFAEDADLQAFFKTYYPAGLGRHFSVVGPNGGVSGVEAALDVQYAMSIGAGVNTTFWYTDAGAGPNPNDTMCPAAHC